MIITATLNPALDKTVWISSFRMDAVNRIERLRVDAGGKGINVSRAAAAFGHETCACAVCAGQAGQTLLRLLEGVIRCEAVPAEGETRTNIKLIDPVSGTHTDINEPGPSVPQAALGEIAARLMSLSSPGDWIVLAGKAPAGTPDTLFADWTRLMHRHGRKVFVDAEGALFAEAVKAAPDGVKPNLHELELWCGEALDSDGRLIEAMRRLSAAGIGLVAVSLGGSGAMLLQDGQIVRAVPPEVEVLGTVGAGDTMAAALLCGMEEQLPLPALAAFATAAGTCAVMTEGTCPPSLEAVRRMQPRVTVTAVSCSKQNKNE